MTTKKINGPVYFKNSIIINAKCKRVWEVLSQIGLWTNWQSNVTESKLTGDFKIDNTFEWKSHGVKIHSKLIRIDQGKYLIYTGKTLGMTATTTWELLTNGNQTKVIFIDSMDGFFATILKGMLNKNISKGGQKWMESLKAECER
ncbi:SRPBCC family protein [Mucilaginibacter sp. UYCu711]|uniref:SRPBCC family protein n=1 Tax=Mucilaginibacter sp. UYCu711 TaxID=3156339 RepID=UPI003D1CAB3E